MIFFPEPGESLAPALAYCRVCPVKGECLEWALNDVWAREVGVFGGTSGRQRRRIRNSRRLEVVAA